MEKCNDIDMEKYNQLLSLLHDIRPEIEARINGFVSAWPGREILCALHRNESLLRRIDDFVK